MGLFECNCPNSLSCCSHLYAACVALPQYRHRAAFLWALRQDLGAAAGSEENPSKQSWSSRAPRGGFEGCRRRVKAALLRHLPLEDVADAAVDAAVGMWVRVEWLRQGRVPKLGAYWADAVERSLGDAAASTDIDLGTAAQDRIRNLLGKLRMKPAELAPLLLALAQGQLPESERLSQRWEGLCRHFWAQVAVEAADGKEGPGKSSSRTLAEVRLAAVAAALEVTPASTSCAAERLWCIEETLLRRYGVSSFSQLQVPKDASKDKDKDCYRSFAEMISDWTEAPKDLRFGSGDGGAADGVVGAMVEREASQLLQELGGQDALPQEEAEDALRLLLFRRFGAVGEERDWAAAAAKAVADAPEEAAPAHRALRCAAAAAFGSAVATKEAAKALVALSEEGWEKAAGRLIQAAPALVALGEWLAWEEVFAAQVGSLREFLHREAPGLGIFAFEVESDFIKMDAASGTAEAFSAALEAQDSRKAAEAMLALVHSCGGLRSGPLQALQPGLRQAAASLGEAYATLMAQLMQQLPRPFRENTEVLRAVLEPLSTEADLHRFAEAAPLLADRAALLGAVKAPFLLRRAAERLATATRTMKEAAATFTGRSATTTRTQPSTTRLESGSQSSKTQEAARPAAAAAQASSSSSVSADGAEGLVAAIRREEFGFEGEEILGSELQVKQNARLARALKRLAGELYGSDVHWQLELLQNADDNSYQNGTLPTAEFLLRASEGGEVIFRCNETGFREADIRAICDIGNSSKVGVAKYGPGGRVVATGEKGLGFKAVFALTDRPRLFSGPYRLEFDSQHPSGIGYVLPRWLEDAEEARELCRPSWGSVLRMPLRTELQPRKEELFRRLASLPPSLLLFLKRLRQVSVEFQGMSASAASAPNEEGADGLRVRYAEDAAVEARWEEMTGPVKLEVSRDGGQSWEADHWLLLRRRFQVPEGLSKPGLASPGPPSTLLELALPKSPEGGFDRSRGAQQVFAFLPVRSYGLPFALQADWAVSSSREELLAGCAWNEFLKAQVPQLILELVAAVRAEPVDSALRWTYYAAIPATATASTFFRPMVAQVLAKLRGCECMLTDEETFCQPQQAMRCSEEARAAFDGCSPLRAALRAQGFHLLHEKVEASAPAGLLDGLGVQRLGAAALLRLLPKAEAFPGLDSWRQILVLLDQLLDAAPRNDASRLVEVARQLPLLPLQGDGSLQPAASKLVLPPVKPEVEGFPPELLAELRAVDPRLFAEGGADRADTDEGTLDALAAARIRKLLRRLGVVPLTPRLVVKDIIGPLFSTCAVVPCVVPVDEAPRSPSALLALGGFLAKNAALAEELGPSSAIGWPLKAMDKVAVGQRFFAPALHSPRAAAFLEAAKGVLDIHLPAAPTKLGTTTALGEALETLGLALPGPLVTAADGDFRSPEFEQLTVAIAKEARETGSLERARLLAQALNVAWQSSYLRYARRGDGVVSSFMLALQSSWWLPPDDLAEEDGDQAPLCCPAELVAGTAAVRAALPDAALLKGRLCSAVSGAFAEALGVVTEPSVELVMKVLRGFATHSPVGPDSATAIYGYLERAGADLAELQRMPSVVVAAGEAARVPADVVWEDANCDLPALQQLYSARWRRFFVIGLGVPEHPTAEQVLRRLDQLSASTAPSAALWPLLLRVAKELSDASSADAEAWAALPAALGTRRCVPLQLGGLGAPKEGVLLEDDVEGAGVPEAALATLRAQAPLAAPAPRGAKDAEHWPVLADALKLQSLSTVCSITSIYGGEERPAPVIAKAVASLLPLAQRFLIHKHRAVYDSFNATCLTRKVEKLLVREVDPPLKLRCIFSVVPGQDPIQAEVESDCYLQVRSGRVEEASYEVRLRMVCGATLPALCVELARLLLPSAKPAKQDEVARVRQTREALATFLASAALAGESGASSLCEALQIPALPSEDSPDYTSPWPMPKEVAEQLELERRLLEAAQETEPERLLPPRDDEDQEPPAEPPSKRARTEGPEAVMAEAAILEGAAKDRLAEMDLGKEEHEPGSSAARDGEVDGCADPASGTALEEVSETEMKDAEALLKNISVIDQQIGENGEGKGAGKGKGKGKGKGSGKGGDKPGQGDKERSATELGRILDRLPGISNAPEEESSEAKKEKAFRTRVYDLEDLRAQSKKMRLAPLPSRNDLPQEEREKVGRWGEQFVYEYLQKKLEHEDSQKRVVWVNEVEETGFQYDLRIEDSTSGDVEAYVEVKTSRAKDKQLFEMSYREWTFAQKEGGKFVIFRVSNAGKEDVELCSITNPFRQWKELNLGLCLTF
ncbi:NOV [Symbiodinium sp. CCMP2592]|nr:NOV [Symbiodinium sp. CCMP2592]